MTETKWNWEVDANNTSLCTRAGVLFSYDMKKLYSYPATKTDEEYVGPLTVTEIRNYAFKDNAKIKKITLGENVENIYEGAFRNCTALEKIIIDKKLNQ